MEAGVLVGCLVERETAITFRHMPGADLEVGDAGREVVVGVVELLGKRLADVLREVLRVGQVANQRPVDERRKGGVAGDPGLLDLFVCVCVGGVASSQQSCVHLRSPSALACFFHDRETDNNHLLAYRHQSCTNIEKSAA